MDTTDDKKKEDLRCPASHPQYHSAYDTLEKDITDFESINALQDGIKLTYLNDGSGIAKTLLANNAVYHKSWRSNCNGNLFKRERCKRVSQSQTPPSLKDSLQFQCQLQSHGASMCHVWEKGGSS